MKNKKNYLKNVLITLVAFLVYFTFSYVEVAILNLLGLEVETLSTTFKTIYLIICEAIEMGIIIFLFLPSLKKDIKDIKEKHETYFKTYFKYWIMILAIMMLSNLMITYLTESTTSGNQEAINDIMVKSPVYAYFSAVIFAPIVEELLFRRGLRNIIKNDTIFILISGLIFGGLHIITGYSNVEDLLYLIPYCTPGLIFAYILTKTDNVLVSSSIHFVHNGILTALQMFTYLFLS